MDLKRDKMLEVLGQLRSETDRLRRAQRKTKNYEYRPDIEKLPRLREPETKKPDVAHSTTLPSSPLRKGTLPAVGGAPSAVEAVEAMRAGAEADGGLMSLDEYDPKEAAARDLARARDEVTRLRTETSDLRHAVEIAERQLEKVQTEAESLLREDDVEEQRRVAEAELGELKRNVELLTAKLEAAEQYELTLRHMLSRLQFDKLSHMAMMKAFEEALRVHRHEAKLHERHLQQAQRAAADEEEELRSLVAKQQRQKQSLEEKLEARRAEVLARQRRKAEREKWLREEMNLKARAEGDLTEEEEKQLKKKAASLRAEAITLAKRLRYAIGKSDQLESDYNRVRVAASIPQTEMLFEDDGSPAFCPPAPDRIVERYQGLHGEMVDVDANMHDLNRRLAHLLDARARLKNKLEPRARDAIDETHVVREDVESIEARMEDSKRRIETAVREQGRLSRLRIQLEQSITSLALVGRQIPVSDAVRRRLLDAGPGALILRATPWVERLVAKIRDAKARFVSARDELDLNPAVVELSREAKMDHALTATIESFITTNESGIRIKARPDGPTTTAAANEGYSLDDFTNAAQQFTASHSRLVRAAAGGAGGAGAGAEALGSGRALGKTRAAFPDTPARRGSMSRAHSTSPESQVSEEEKREDGSSDPSEKGTLMKAPKARELTKFLAAAVSMTGSDLKEELYAVDRDAEDILDRDRIKRKSENDVRHHELLASRTARRKKEGGE